MAKAKSSFIPKPQEKKTLEWLWACASFETKYPALYELLAKGIFEGEPRKGATVTLFASDGRLKAQVCDRETDQAVWLTLEPFEDVLAEIELALSSGSATWAALKKNGAKPVF